MATLENLLSPALVERLGWTLIHFVWQAAVIALLLAVVLKALPKGSAGIRYLAACVALVLIVALPLVTMALVEVSEPVAEAGPAPIPAPVLETTPVEVVEVAELPPLQINAQPLEMADMTVHVPWTQRAATALEPALPYLVLGWLLGVFGLSAWHLGGWAQLQRMRRRMVSEVAAPLHAKLRELAAALGIKRAVALLESALVEVPTVVGWVKPVILLPASALSGLSPEQLEAILAHELAHIRRYDYLVNIAQTVIEILGFYHPALWWISHKIRAERENCCDDLAVQVCGDSVRYARALTCLEEMRHHYAELAVAASGGSLVARIGRLLGRPATDDRRFTWLPGLIALLLVAATIIPTALVLAAPPPSLGEGSHSEAVAPRTSQAPKQVVLSVIVGKFSSDETLDRATAIRARRLLADAARGGQFEVPSVEELQKPLWQVVDKYVADVNMPGTAAKAFTDLLISARQVNILGTPNLQMCEGSYSRLIFGGEPSSDVAPVSDQTDRFRVTVEMMPTVQDGSDAIQFAMRISGENVATRNLQERSMMQFGEFTINPNPEGSLRNNEYRMLFFPLILCPKGADAAEETGVFLLLVKPIVTGPAPDDVAAEPTTVYVPLNPPGSSVSSDDMSVGDQPAATVTVSPKANAPSPGETAIRIDCMFTEVLIDKILDRATVQRICDILANENSKDRDELARLAAQENVTLGDVLRKWVARESLTQATMEALIDLFKAGGYAKIEAAPSIQVRNGKSAEVRTKQELPILAPGAPASSTQYVDVGYTVQATPHFSRQAGDRITLEIMAQCTEPIGAVQADKLPTVSTTEVASTVTVRRDRFFSLLLEPDEAGDTPSADRTAKLIMFRADCVAPPAQPENASIPPAPQNASQPRQVLLDVLVVESEGDNFRNLGIEWASPQVSAGSFAPGGASNAPWGVEIGYAADRDFTNALNAALRQLRDRGLARLLSNPQVAALDGRQARITIQTQEYFSLQPQATADDPAPQAELVPVTAGTVLSATPRLGNHDEITLEIAVEYSDTRSPKASEGLPMVTRRTARNVVTVKDGGTVALAGLSGSQEQVAILVTASLALESAAPPQPGTASVVLPPREPANVEAPTQTRRDSGPVVMSEARGNRFIHTNADGKIDREFGFEELLHSNSDQWTVTNPYMDLFGKDIRCSIAAERGHIQLDTGLGQPTPGDATFSGNVVVDMTPVERDSAETCVLHADRLTYNTDKNRLSCSGPARFVCGSTEYVGRGLDLFPGPAPSRPDGKFVMTVSGVNLYMTPSSSLIVTLGEGQAPAVVTQARAQRTESDSSRQKTGFHIRLDFTVMKVAANKKLDQETAAQVAKWLSAADGNDVSAKAWSPSDLRQYPVDQLLETLRQDVPPESFKAFVDVLTSRRYVTPLFNPVLVVAEGQQAEIAGGETRLAVVAETENNGHAIRINARLDLTVREPLSQLDEAGGKRESAPATFQTVGSLAILRAANKGYALQRLAGVTTPGSDGTSDSVYYLLVRPVLVVPVEASEAIAPTTFERNLLKVLAEIGNRTGKRIEVDETVKPQPVAADLETMGFAEVVLPRVLEDTPYTYRKMSDDVYLVYRPITATFRGADLRTALMEIGERAGVPVVCDPNISGEVYADLQGVTLETALRTILGGSPFVAEETADGYAITTREESPAPPAKQTKDAVHVEARFVLVDNALMEALQSELPIEGITAPEDANALYEIGAAIAAREPPLLEETQVGLLLRAIQRSKDSKALAAPRVTVLDGKAATFSMMDTLNYIGGYGEPNDTVHEPIPQHKSKILSVTFDVTPHLLKNQDSVRLQFQAEITSLVEMHKALYQGKYEYDVPSFETVTIQTELVVPEGQTALVHGRKLRSLNGTQPNRDEPERTLFVLITPAKSSVTPTGSVPPVMSGTGPGAPGMGGFAPETTPSLRN